MHNLQKSVKNNNIIHNLQKNKSEARWIFTIENKNIYKS